EQRLKDASTDLAVQSADSIDDRAAAQCQVGHIERLGAVLGVCTAQSEQVLHRDLQLFLGIVSEVVLDELGCKPIKSRRHGRMSGEDIPGPRYGECDLERLAA